MLLKRMDFNIEIGNYLKEGNLYIDFGIHIFMNDYNYGVKTLNIILNLGILYINSEISIIEEGD